jgi:hypothetical protein
MNFYPFVFDTRLGTGDALLSDGNDPSWINFDGFVPADASAPTCVWIKEPLQLA